MSKKTSYADRLKKMKQSIEESKDLLHEDFPDDATVIGNPEFITDEERETDEDDSEEDSHGK